MDTPESNSLHERAAASARETRLSIIRLSAVFIGGLFFVATKSFEPALTGSEKLVIVSILITMFCSFGFGIFLSYADAQWSYCWGLELNDSKSDSEREAARQRKLLWHDRKALSEKMMLISFILGVLLCALFVIIRFF